MQNRENDIVLFMDENIQLEVPVSQDGESVWLSANQMAVLFDKDETNIRKHINNIFKSSEVDKNNNTQKMRVDGVKQSVAFYSLDVILAVGYRVNSKRGIAFRKWANNVLKQYIATVYKGHTKKLNHGLPILHKVPPKRDYGRYFCIMAEKGGTTHGDLAEKLSSFFHA